MAQFSPCDLHLPHKGWADDARELVNYAVIEQWATTFRTNCLPSAGAPAASPAPIAVTLHRRARVMNYSTNTGQDVEYVADLMGSSVGIPSALVQTPTLSFIPPGDYIQVAAQFTFHENTTNTNPVSLRQLTLYIRGMPGNVPLFNGTQIVNGQHNQNLTGFVQALNLVVPSSYSYAEVHTVAQFGFIIGVPYGCASGSLTVIGSR
jgi:hypothetical protein